MKGLPLVLLTDLTLLHKVLYGLLPPLPIEVSSDALHFLFDPFMSGVVEARHNRGYQQRGLGLRTPDIRFPPCLEIRSHFGH